MGTADQDAPPARAAARPPAPRSPAGRLSQRLVWLTVATVLIAEALFFLPSLARARHDWLERHLRAGQIAALSADGGKLQNGIRADLLTLAGVEAVTLQESDRTLRLTRAGVTPDGAVRTDLPGDSLPAAAAGVIGGLVGRSDALLDVRGPSLLDEGGSVAVLVRRAALDHFLSRFALRVGAISLAVAGAVGLLLFCALTLLLVRPLHRLTESIAAFRADPERAAPYDGVTHGDDEIAVAGRELAAMQRELRAALWRNARLAALGTSVAKINHDLRGILSPALLTAERLQMSEEPGIKRAGDTLVRAVERATTLVRSIVEFAREIPVAPQRARIALRPVVAEAADQALHATPDLAIDNAVPEAMEIDAERASIVRVLTNLLRNAGEARAHHVRVTAEQEGGVVAVTVADDGPGLPDAVQAALFRPFVTGGRPGSTGLGLAIVRDLVRAHGGEASLLATSASGTSFRITLPRAARHTAPPAMAPQPPVELRG